jgi:lysophospholipase
MLREHPDLRMAGATWGWLDAAFRSIDYLRPRAGEIATPLLMVGAGKDRICLTPQTRDFAARAHARYLEIEGAEHEILMERNLYRQQFWTAFDGFLRTQKHAAPQP